MNMAAAERATPTPEERAAKVYPPPIRPLGDKIDTDVLRGIAYAIRAAETAAAAAMRERAAGVVEGAVHSDITNADIAAAVRALPLPGDVT